MTLWLRVGAVVFLLLAVASVTVVGWAPVVPLDLVASPNAPYWDTVWKGADDPVIDGKQGALPTNLPGPADGWAGGKPRSFAVTFDAPAGEYELTLTFHDAHESAPPTLRITMDETRLPSGNLPAGKGKPPPYEGIDERMTLTGHFSLSAGGHTFTVVNEAGSWAAPARLTLTGESRFDPWLALWELMDEPLRLLSPVVLLLLALVAWRAPSAGSGAATGEGLLVAFSLLIGLTVGEGAFRLWLMRGGASSLETEKAVNPDTAGGNLPRFGLKEMLAPSDDPDIPYRLKAGLDGLYLGARVRTNAYGFRSAQLSLEKPAGVYRIVGLGDSYLFGWGVEENEGVLEQLARMIEAETGLTVETINTAVPGYNTAVEVATYRKLARRFHPDLVALLFVGNDFYFPSIMVEPPDYTAPDSSFLAERLKRLAAMKLKRTPEKREVVTTQDLDHLEEKKDDRATFVRRVKGFYDTMTGPEAIYRSFGELAETVAEDGAVGAFIWPPYELRLGAGGERYEPRMRETLDAAAKAGFVTPDLVPPFAAYLESHGVTDQKDILWLTDTDSHPTPDGHRIMAETLFEALKSQGRLPTKR